MMHLPTLPPLHVTLWAVLSSALVLAAPLQAAPLPATQAERLAQLDSAALNPAARTAIAATQARLARLGPFPAGRYLLVNIPAYEISLFDGPVRVQRWRAIVGKPRTPTPELVGQASGVILNPWWNVPDSIVAESVGSLMTRRPAEAARRGYVRDGSRVRQRPGPDNQLGQMKLDFINPHSIGIHDTPSRSLFARDRRALSHGCIRVDDALGFAATLLADGSTRDSLAALLPDRQTQRLAFARPLPVIIGYFTAEVDDSGQLIVHDDIYRRDRQALAMIGAMTGGLPDQECRN